MFDFKTQMQKDLSVFINPAEFGEIHMVEGKETEIVIDDDRLTELKAGADIGIADSSLLFYAKILDLPKRKEQGEALNVDGREYIVDSWRENMGMAEVSLSQRRTS